MKTSKELLKFCCALFAGLTVACSSDESLYQKLLLRKNLLLKNLLPHPTVLPLTDSFTG